MAVFPSIKPNTRSLGLGNTPQLVYAGTSQATIRFLKNTKRVGQTLELSFSNITESQMNAIFDHFNGQEGTLIPFTLPSEIWTGYNSVPISAVDYEWRYAESLSIEKTSPDRYSLIVSLVSSII